MRGLKFAHEAQYWITLNQTMRRHMHSCLPHCHSLARSTKKMKALGTDREDGDSDTY